MVQDHTVLHLAVFADDEAAVKMLMQAGAEVNAMFAFVRFGYVSYGDVSLCVHAGNTAGCVIRYSR